MDYSFLDKLKKEIERLTAKVDESDLELRRLSSADYQNTIEQLRNVVENNNKEIHNHTEELKTMSKNICRKDEEISVLKAKSAGTQSSIDTLKTELANASKFFGVRIN